MVRGGWLRRNRVRVASGCVVLAAAGSVVAYALAANGYEVHRADLNDGGVWVTKADAGYFGRMNKPVGQFDGITYSTSGASGPVAIDVLQDGAAVVDDDQSKDSIYPIDVSSLQVGRNAGIHRPESAELGMGGGTLALLDRSSGALRAMTYDPDEALYSLDGLDSRKPDASIGRHGAMAVAVDGTVFAASAAKGLTVLHHAGRTVEGPETSNFAGLDGTLSMTAVGDTPVVLEAEQGSSAAVVVLPGGKSVRLPSAQDAVLQQPGPASSDVLVATSQALWAVPVVGGKARRLSDAGNGNNPAAPVFLGGCTFAAWPGATGVFARSCSDAPTKAAPIPSATTTLAFRVNRDELLLNDTEDGGTWNVDSGTPVEVDDWQALTPPSIDKQNQQKNTQLPTQQQKIEKPKAVNVELGARPGVVTPLYVLDHDQASGPGQILAIDSITPLTSRAASWLSIAPDAQAVDIAMPAGNTSDVAFSYTVSAAGGAAASAVVTVHARTSPPNNPPVMRYGYTPHTYTVPLHGTVTIPVLPDWRDYLDGDQVVLQSATATGGTVAATSDGTLVYSVTTAQPGPQTIRYVVNDGHGGMAKGSVSVVVQSGTAAPVAATAEPDFARGAVNTPITIYPLDNDLPGSDPQNLTASLSLTGTLGHDAAIQASYDAATGRLTAQSSTPNSYTITYHVAYGSAPVATGSIRVDVTRAASKLPITAPDVAVVHGQAPADVDVLANDSDPFGDLLVIQSATAADPGQLSVAVIDGRYLRVQASVPTLSPATQTVDYVVTDGVTGQVQGQLTVDQLPAPADDTPILRDDYATVRAGASVAVPVLDNDTTPAGDPLTLVTDAQGAPAPGQFAVSPAVGAAYVSGSLVRYVAPASVTTTTDATVAYEAQNSAGDSPPVGYLHVTVVPASAPDHPPTPQDVEARTVAGDTVTIKIPTSGVDPDGDPVQVVGVTSAPQLGRILRVSPSSITYQSFPFTGNGGTDTFGYVVADTQGETANATIRVAVVPPGDPQPPVAVNDSVTVAPGAVVRVDPLANDFVAAGDHVSIEPLARFNPELPVGTARLLSPTGPIEIRAGNGFRNTITVNYTITDGLHSDPATIYVDNAPGANLPPVAVDIYPPVPHGATGLNVDLLAHDFDPDGSAAPTVISPASATSGVLPVTLRPFPQVIPYVIRDALGATASAVVYVPAAGAGLPYANGKVIQFTGKTATVDIRDFVTDPAGRIVRLTTKTGTSSAAPSSGLTVQPGADQYHLVLTAQNSYVGPAAVTFQVTDGQTLGQAGAETGYVTVPAQVGIPTPVLRCPPTVIDVTQGGQPQSIPVATLCHVWTPDPASAASTRFSATWAKQPPGTTLSGSGTTTLSVRAGTAASSQAPGLITVGLAQYPHAPTQQISVLVVRAGNLTISPPISVTGTKAGSPITVDLRGHVVSPFGTAAAIGVVGTPSVSPAGSARVSVSGSRITVTPGTTVHGVVTVSFVATDVAGQNQPGRNVAGSMTLQVAGPPDAPTGLTINGSTSPHDGRVDLKWNAPNSNGGGPLSYTVHWTGVASGAAPCGQVLACQVSNLKNGSQYRFTVNATNGVSTGPSSAPFSATPDTAPSAVTNFLESDVGDRTLKLTWSPVSGNFSKVTGYIISWSGGTVDLPASATGYQPTNLNNDTTYRFSIAAVNIEAGGEIGKSDSTIAKDAYGQYAQTVGQPGQPVVLDSVSRNADNRGQDVVQLTWAAVDSNGPGPVTYTVTRASDSGGQQTLCVNRPNLYCSDDTDLDGSQYSYTVVATNGPQEGSVVRSSAPSSPIVVVAAAQPDGFSNVSSQVVKTTPDGQAMVSFGLGASNGKSSNVTCIYAGGSSCFAMSYGRQAQQINNAIFTFSAGYQGSYTLRQCNGTTDGPDDSGCATETESISVNGPPGPPQISCGLTGSTVVFRWPTPESVGARSVDHYEYSGAASGSTAATSVPVSEPSDGGASSLSVKAVDSAGESSSVSTRSCPHAQPVQGYVYNNYGSAQREVFMCAGAGAGAPGGTLTQTMTVPNGIRSITEVVVQADDNPGVSITASVIVNGLNRGTATSPTGGDVTFNYSSIGVSPGDSVVLQMQWSSTGKGTINGVYLTSAAQGTFNSSNSCPKQGDNLTTSSQGLRAQVIGYS